MANMENKVILGSRKAAAAFLAASQFTMVDLDASGEVIPPSGEGVNALGIKLDGAVSAKAAVEIGVGGVLKVKAGAATAANVKFKTDAAGKAVLAAAGDHVLGRTLEEATAADQVIEVLWEPQGILA